MRKRINKKSSPDARRMQENVLLICLNYGFIGANFIISSIFSSIFESSPSDPDFRHGMLIGIVMLCMVPLSYFDDRKGMRGKLNVVATSIAHLGLSLWISYMYLSWWYMILYAVEVVISMSIVYIKHTRHKKKKQNKIEIPHANKHRLLGTKGSVVGKVRALKGFRKS